MSMSLSTGDPEYTPCVASPVLRRGERSCPSACWGTEGYHYPRIPLAFFAVRAQLAQHQLGSMRTPTQSSWFRVGCHPACTGVWCQITAPSTLVVHKLLALGRYPSVFSSRLQHTAAQLQYTAGGLLVQPECGQLQMCHEVELQSWFQEEGNHIKCQSDKVKDITEASRKRCKANYGQKAALWQSNH